MSTSKVTIPSCGTRCCTADYSGRFASVGKLPTGATRYSHQPFSQPCRFSELTRAQVIAVLEKNNAPLVVLGDSMMRQVYIRLVMMMRGQQRLLDYKILTNAQYLACPEADAFRIASVSANGSATGGNSNNSYLRVRIFLED